jgi:hypothetical protein
VCVPVADAADPVADAELLSAEPVTSVLVAPSAVTPVLLEQELTLTAALVKVISAHYSRIINCCSCHSPKTNTHVVKATTSVSLLYNLDSRIVSLLHRQVRGKRQVVPAERAQSNLQELVLDNDREVIRRRVVAQSEVHRRVRLVVAGLDGELAAAAQRPLGPRSGRSVFTAARRGRLRLVVVATVRGVVHREVGRDGGGEEGEEDGGGTHLDCGMWEGGW